MLFKLAVNNIFSRKSSIVIILFIAFTTGLFGIANAFFDSTDNGLQQSYIQNFTGDLIITPKTKIQLSLFGDETPVTGNLSKIPLLEDSKEISRLLNADTNYTYTTQLTAPCFVEKDSKRQYMYLFGVNPSEYLEMMKGITITEGTAFEDGQRGVLINSKLSQTLDTGIGDKLQFIVNDGPTFRIRAAEVTGIYSSSTGDEGHNQYVITDRTTAASLLGLELVNKEEVVISEEKADLLNQDINFDDLFEDDIMIEEAEEETSSEEYNLPVTSASLDAANFFIIKLNNSKKAKSEIAKINAQLRENKINATATDWRHAAGSAALYLYWIRIIFNIGICIILVSGYIIVNNTLVINVMDRTREIGTMRAFGTPKEYISIECLIETVILTVSGGIAGLILSFIGTKLITEAHIVLTNSFLIQLFGSSAIRIGITQNTIFVLLGIMALLCMAGWIIPVMNALKVTPISAMQEAK